MAGSSPCRCLPRSPSFTRKMTTTRRHDMPCCAARRARSSGDTLANASLNNQGDLRTAQGYSTFTRIINAGGEDTTSPVLKYVGVSLTRLGRVDKDFNQRREAARLRKLSKDRTVLS